MLTQLVNHSSYLSTSSSLLKVSYNNIELSHNKKAEIQAIVMDLFVEVLEQKPASLETPDLCLSILREQTRGHEQT